MPNAAKEEIGIQIRDRRRALRLTQVELARGARISQGMLSRVERGERALSPRLALRVRVALYHAERDATRIDPLDIGIPLGDLLAIHRETEAAR
jgi:transcriptional regulator with XRE-family HTH domain